MTISVWEVGRGQILTESTWHTQNCTEGSADDGVFFPPELGAADSLAKLNLKGQGKGAVPKTEERVT